MATFTKHRRLIQQQKKGISNRVSNTKKQKQTKRSSSTTTCADTCFNPFEQLVNSSGNGGDDQHAGAWLENLIVSSLDALAAPCDSKKKGGLLQRTLDDLTISQSPSSSSSTTSIINNDLLNKNDYALLHDEFLEALLYEQIQKLFLQEQQKQQQQQQNGNINSNSETLRLGDTGRPTDDDDDDEESASSFSFKSQDSSAAGSFMNFSSFVKLARSNSSFNKSNHPPNINSQNSSSSINTNNNTSSNKRKGYPLVHTNSSSSLTEDDGTLTRRTISPPNINMHNSNPVINNNNANESSSNNNNATTNTNNHPPRSNKIVSFKSMSPSKNKKSRRAVAPLSSSSSSSPPTTTTTVQEEEAAAKQASSITSTPTSLSTTTNNNIDNSHNREHSIQLAMKGLHLSQTSYPNPSTYMNKDCKLQKDRGDGVEPGSVICASNINQCLDKLQSKMELVIQMVVPHDLNASNNNNTPTAAATAVAGGVSSSSNTNLPPSSNVPTSVSNYKQKNYLGGRLAAMKRKQAYISDIKHDDSRSSTESTTTVITRNKNYVETRSKLELRLGFMSMQYGILARWDIRSSGKIILVVLRKMCTESFYSKDNVPAHVQQFLQHQKLHILPPPQLLSIRQPSVLDFTESKSKLLSNTKNKLKEIGGIGSGSNNNNTSSKRRTSITKNNKTRGGYSNTLSSSQHAILQRPNGTEVTLLQKPYMIDRPDMFDPARLLAQVHRVNFHNLTYILANNDILSSSTCSTWTLVLTLDKNQSYQVKLEFSKDKQYLYCKDPYEWKLPQSDGTNNSSSSTSGSSHCNGIESHRLDLELWEDRTLKPSSASLDVDSSQHTATTSNTTTTTSSNKRRGFLNKSNNSSNSSVNSKNNNKKNSSKNNNSSVTVHRDRILRLKSSIPLTFFDVSSRISEKRQVSCTNNNNNNGSNNGSNKNNNNNTSGSNNSNYEVILNLYHQSDYAYWLYQELEARKRCHGPEDDDNNNNTNFSFEENENIFSGCGGGSSSSSKNINKSNMPTGCITSSSSTTTTKPGKRRSSFLNPGFLQKKQQQSRGSTSKSPKKEVHSQNNNDDDDDWIYFPTSEINKNLDLLWYLFCCG